MRHGRCEMRHSLTRVVQPTTFESAARGRRFRTKGRERRRLADRSAGASRLSLRAPRPPRSLVHSPYAILAHSAGALAAARVITNTRASIPAAMPNALVHQGVASVGRTFSTVDDALRGFRRIYPTIPDERLRSFVTEGLRRVDGRVRASRGREHSDLSRKNCGPLERIA